MTVIHVASSIVLIVVVPFLVQAIKTEAMSGTAARWVAVIASIVAGLFAGFVCGVPAEPAAWLTCVFAMVGGVQTAYTAFKSVGVTSKWLDALLAVNVGGKDE